MAFFLTLLLWVGFFILSELLRPSPEREALQPSGLGDFNFPTATEGRPVPVIFGTVKVDGPNVVWYGDLVQQPITERVRTGLFSKSTFTTGFRYRVGIQCGLCRGQVDKFTRLWVGDDVAWEGELTGDDSATIDLPELFGGDDLGNGGVGGTFSFKSGTEAQAALPYLTSFQLQGGDTPAYRGTCYVTFEQFYVGNSANIKPFKFELQRLPTGLGAANSAVNTNDANPVHVLYELITNDEWGLGLPSTDVDTTNFQAAAATAATEGNGFSFVWDRQMELAELLRMIERQLDAVVFINRTTGKWQVNLARGGYVVDDLPQVSSTNLRAVEDFARGAWEDTTNQVLVGFIDRSRDYFRTYARAQDMANFRIQGSVMVSNNLEYPGVMDPDLANQLAWRDLRTLGIPLAKCTLVVDRSFWNVNPGDVVAFTDEELGFVKLPCRVQNVDLGELDQGQIRLEVVEDIFKFDNPSFTAPPATGWTPPSNTLVAVPVADQRVFEAPRAFDTRDPISPGEGNRVWAGARYQNDGAVFFRMQERNASGTPSGAYSDSGSIGGFMLAGELTSALGAGTPTSPDTFDITADPDTQAELVAAIPTVTDAVLGANLTNLLLVGDELVLVKSAAAVGAIVRVDAYRGALDTAPAAHGSGTRVYLLSAGGSLLDAVFEPDFNVDVRLVPESATDQLDPASANVVSVALDRRSVRPYPPRNPEVNGVLYPTTASIDGTLLGTGLDEVGLEFEWLRRDFRSAGIDQNEVDSLKTDAGTLFADFPAANTTQYSPRLIDDPDGAATELVNDGWNSGEALFDVSRTLILRLNGGTLPTRLSVQVKTRHTVNGVVYEALRDLGWDFDVTSGLTGDTALGVLDTNDVSAGYTAPDTGTYTFNIGTDVLGGGSKVEARLNGGSWTSVINSNAVTGTLSGVTAGDTIEVRHDETDPGVETFLEVLAPVSSTNAFGVLIT